MPIASVKLLPGVTSDLTPAANEAGIQSCNLIRFREYAPQGIYAEKMGGWQKYYSLSFPDVPRALHAWQGLRSDQHLAVGTDGQLVVITSGNGNDITPQYTDTTPTVDFSTSVGSAVVTVGDPGTNMTIYDVVVINTPVSVGGIVLYGPYRVTTALGANSYEITAADLATGAVANGGAVPSFATVSGEFAVTVTLNDHGHANGDTAVFPVSTVDNGVDIYGPYTVSQVTANTFVINAGTEANATGSFDMNGGDADIRHWLGIGPAAASGGYGTGGYSVGGYSTGLPAPPHTGTTVAPSDWCFDNWGEDLIANPEDGPIFAWDPDGAFRTATIIPEAPIQVHGAFVAMPQRMIVAYGASVEGFLDPLQVAWCDAGDFSTWTASSLNQAGTFHLSTGSRIVGGLQASQQALLWTDLAVWSMQYLGPPLVWGFNQLATGCGLIGKKAVAIAGNAVFWMSQSQFFRMVGGNVEPLQCPIWDTVFQNLHTSQAARIRAGANSRFNEVWWHYPSQDAPENDSYVKYNYALNAWDYGTLDRSAWIDQSVLGAPIGADPSGWIYQHESGRNAGSLPMSSFLQTGWFSLTDGQDMTFLDWIMPDMKWGTVTGYAAPTLQVTIYVANYPGDTPLTLGPYTATHATQYINTRLRGRLISLRITTTDNDSFWRMGRIRYRIAPDGRIGGP